MQTNVKATSSSCNLSVRNDSPQMYIYIHTASMLQILALVKKKTPSSHETADFPLKTVKTSTIQHRLNLYKSLYNL